jgi:hypothetical protein
MNGAGERPTPGSRLYHGVVRAFSLGFVLVGLAVLVVTLANGGGPASVGVIMGIVFVLVGLGRIWVASRMQA